MRRDQVIVGSIVLVVVALAVSRRVITPQTFLLLGVAIPSIILHEISHGVAALALGDDTAKKAGRITLNPLPHIDPLGTIVLPAVLALSSVGVFGYAKPVPVNPSRMRHPRNDAVMVSLAGPATNVLLALLAALWLRSQHLLYLSLSAGGWQMRIPYAFGLINVVLAVFNLIPVPPLDGSSVVERFLPRQWEDGWNNFRRFGLWIVMGVAVLAPTLLVRLFTPAWNLWLRTIAP